jgi:hypothetical protein
LHKNAEVRECTICCRSSRARTSTIVSQFPDTAVETDARGKSEETELQLY